MQPARHRDQQQPALVQSLSWHCPHGSQVEVDFCSHFQGLGGGKRLTEMLSEASLPSERSCRGQGMVQNEHMHAKP